MYHTVPPQRSSVRLNALPFVSSFFFMISPPCQRLTVSQNLWLCLSFSQKNFSPFLVFCVPNFELFQRGGKRTFNSREYRKHTKTGQDIGRNSKPSSQTAYHPIFQHTFSTLRTALPGVVFREYAALGSIPPLSRSEIISFFRGAFLQK